MRGICRAMMIAAFLTLLTGAFPGKALAAAPAGAPVVVYPEGACARVTLAAREVRRYAYLRTGVLLPLEAAGSLPVGKPFIAVGVLDAALLRGVVPNATLSSRHAYLLKSVVREGREGLVIAGADPAGTLYGAYRFAEHLGVRFYLHGDTIPDGLTSLELKGYDETHAPLFELRGIQPFHDFPEGPDWWNVGDYKAILAQLPKMGMNFFGLHTYPEGGVGPEPTVWIGAAEDIGPDGRVLFSSQARHFTTHNGNWGYDFMDTGDYTCGAGQMYDRDDYGAEYTRGMSPWPETPEDRNELFNRMGALLQEAFSFAHRLDIRTCVGTETPLIIPEMVRKRLEARGKDPKDPAVVQQVYEGLFRRIMQAYPLDFYWFWTPEGWTWSGTTQEQIDTTLADLRAAIAAAEAVEAPFALATCGWVLGPPQDPALFDRVLPKTMAVSCINRSVGFDPVEPGFAHVEGRPQWAIPWLEDDPAMIIPQLWAGRMRRDAADALKYGCTGLMGIHWRTRILGPNVSALAQAAWDQSRWGTVKAEPAPADLPEGPEGGNVAHFGSPMDGTEQDTLYQSVRYNMKAYRLAVPNGTYRVTLQFVEPHYGQANKRVFGVAVQENTVVDSLDVFATAGKNRAVDQRFDGIRVTDGVLVIDFRYQVEFPCIAAIAVKGTAEAANQSDARPFSRKINCGGEAYQDYEADLPPTGPGGAPRDLPVDDFYLDWAQSQFGAEAASSIAALFVALDGDPKEPKVGGRKAALPRPADWVDGPGGIRPSTRRWARVQAEYAFVEAMEGLRLQVRGAGNLERFDYWLNTFRYLRALDRLTCTWTRFNKAFAKVKQETDTEKRVELAREQVLPIRRKMVLEADEVTRYLLATVSTTGGMGNMTNWQQHGMAAAIHKPGQELAGLLGEALSPDALPSVAYRGAPRLFLPTVRGCLVSGERLELRAIVLGSAPREVAVYWRHLGDEELIKTPLVHVSRGVYAVTLPAAATEGDLEYHVRADTGSGAPLYFPATAPERNQTVVIMPGL